MRVVPCNWKVALEAFIESYHTVAVHPQLLKTSGDTQTQYDVYEGVRHVNRMITPVGIASEHVERGRRAGHPRRHVPDQGRSDASVPEGVTARQVLAERTRRQLAQRTGGDYSSITDCEALDAIEYFVFPNFVPWAGYTTPSSTGSGPTVTTTRHRDGRHAARARARVGAATRRPSPPAISTPASVGPTPPSSGTSVASSTRTPPPWPASSAASSRRPGPM